MGLFPVSQSYVQDRRKARKIPSYKPPSCYLSLSRHRVWTLKHLDKTSPQRSSSVQIKPLQSIVLSCERVPGTLQPSEFLGEFVQADGWARLPVTPLNHGSGKLRRTFLMSRSPHGSSRFEFRIRPEKSRRLVIPRTSCWRCSRRLVRAAARPSARQLCRSRRNGRCQHPRFPCLPSPSSARVQKPDRRRWRLV